MKIKIPNNVASLIDEYLAKFKNADEKTRYIVFGAILLGFFFVDYFLIMGPQLKALADINPKVTLLSGDISRTKSDFIRLSQYRDEIKDLKGTVGELEFSISSKQELQTILERISRIANENRLRIDYIMPKTSNQKEMLKQDERTYYSLPISIEAISGYHNFGKFLNQLERDNFFFNIVNFTISPELNTKNNLIKLTLSTIIYEED